MGPASYTGLNKNYLHIFNVKILFEKATYKEIELALKDAMMDFRAI